MRTLTLCMKKSHGARSYEHDVCFNTGFDLQLKIALQKAVTRRHISITQFFCQKFGPLLNALQQKFQNLKAECLTIFQTNFAFHFNVSLNPSTIKGIKSGIEILRTWMTQLQQWHLPSPVTVFLTVVNSEHLLHWKLVTEDLSRIGIQLWKYLHGWDPNLLAGRF